MSFPSHLPWFYHLNNIWLGVLIMLLWLCYFSQSPVTSSPLGPNVFQHPILKHPYPVFSPCCGRPSLTPILSKSFLRQFQRMRCSLRTCVACHAISVPSEETKCYISEARSRVHTACMVASLGAADLTATANSPVVIFGQWLDCSLLHQESQEEGVLGLRSIADVDILWLTQWCGFLDICAHLHTSRRWQNRCKIWRLIAG
jgi:hypothetical protein